MDKRQLWCALDHSNSSFSTLPCWGHSVSSAAPSLSVHWSSLCSAPTRVQLTPHVPVCNTAWPYSLFTYSLTHGKADEASVQVWALNIFLLFLVLGIPPRPLPIPLLICSGGE